MLAWCRRQPNFLPLVWRGNSMRGCPIKCDPHHLTMIQNYKVAPKSIKLTRPICLFNRINKLARFSELHNPKRSRQRFQAMEMVKNHDYPRKGCLGIVMVRYFANHWDVLLLCQSL
ncbi:hypothetical protein AVEN_257345-1 [Araneus ventricosus]|uniref:Uncharacterized protein n=1 Tax=Araneus ventricosus TaxID=182803 RepID=A0A4Y2C8R0_ARAVE|nr:hypothetical protein AVEN_257345-1 [Araneus ventricosus]